jgi:demethylmenaquinone methyltransferase/2-methoxy-6-polyprenyl-1,4-benzoquinol methylase
MLAQRGRTDDERDYYALSERVFKMLAPFYDLVTMPFIGLRRRVAAMAGFHTGARVLDVATGTGAQAFAFTRKGAQVVGIDLSEAMLAVARRKNRSPSLTFRQADATELPFADGAFDIACISFGLHEMPKTVRERTLREMARVTKVDGTILVVDYGLPKGRLARWLVYHLVKMYEGGGYAEFVKSDLRAQLLDVGFHVLEDRAALGGAARTVRASRRA